MILILLGAIGMSGPATMAGPGRLSSAGPETGADRRIGI
jgi:hypothetical protein